MAEETARAPQATKASKVLPARELTLRAVLTGVVLGALLTPCNIYSGLKIGWSFNMSITAALLSYAFWQGLARLGWARPWGLLESNINQTTASSAASIISGGLVAPIPALALITGQTLGWLPLTAWVFAVSALGIVVAMAVREPLLERERLTFPAGVATAETIREIFAEGREAMLRVRALLGTMAAAFGLMLTGWLKPIALPGAIAGWGEVAGRSISLTNLSFSLNPSLLLFGFGGIIGLRAGLSLLVGALVAWGLLGPLALAQGWVEPGPDDPSVPWFGPLTEWLLWPGVALMVVASLTQLLLAAKPWQTRATASSALGRGLPPRFWLGLLVAGSLVVALQVGLFGISWFAAVLAVPVAFALGLVAARVVGETGIPPIGALAGC